MTEQERLQLGKEFRKNNCFIRVYENDQQVYDIAGLSFSDRCKEIKELDKDEIVLFYFDDNHSIGEEFCYLDDGFDSHIEDLYNGIESGKYQMITIELDASYK